MPSATTRQRTPAQSRKNAVISSPPAAAVAGARRAPVQERGRRRVQQLLTAAAEVIAEVGVDNATTNAVAARASTSVGVLYKFFPNKQALVEALAQRYVDSIDDLLLRQEQEGISRRPLHEAIDWVVRAIVRLHEQNPAFQHVYRAARGSGESQGARLLDQTKRVIDRLLAQRVPTAPVRLRELHATTAVEAAHALVVCAIALPPRERAGLTEQAVLLLMRYLEPHYARANQSATEPPGVPAAQPLAKNARRKAR